MLSLWSMVDDIGEDVSCVFNAADPRLPLVSCSADFSMLFSGPSQFRIVDKDMARLRKILYKRVTSGQAIEETGELWLRCFGHQGPKWRIEFQVRCVFQIADWDDNQRPVRCTFMGTENAVLKRLKKNVQNDAVPTGWVST